jgi:hypothetical protein
MDELNITPDRWQKQRREAFESNKAVKADDGRWVIPFKASDNLPDVMNDRIVSWDLSDYRGAVGMVHDRRLNLGKARVEWRDGALSGTMAMAKPGTGPIVDEVVNLMLDGMMTDLSIVMGRPKDPNGGVKANDIGGFDFILPQLIKIDIVDVGCNQRARAYVKSLGRGVNQDVLQTVYPDWQVLGEWAEQRKMLETMTKSMSGADVAREQATVRLDELTARLAELESKLAAQSAPRVPGMPIFLQSKEV